MVVTCVHVWVKDNKIDEFIEACKINHQASIKEPGNIRFDVIQDMRDSSKFMLYEAYESEEASAAHKETEHYKIWRNTVADWMAKPREGIKHRIICP